jgi:Mn-dependent DtxR family transcriptional regulator
MSLEARMTKLQTQLIPKGKIIVAHRHSCQTEHALKDKAVEALGRPLRPADCLVIIDTCDEPCPPDTHAHHETVLIYLRP